MFIKKAFTLFEVLISTIVLSIVLISFSKLQNNSEQFETYKELEYQENIYKETKEFKNSEKIKFYHYP